MLQVSLQDARLNFGQLLQKAIGGEIIVICEKDTPIVKLLPLKTSKRKRKLGTAKGKIKIASDFDEPLDDFYPVKRIW